MLYGCLIRYHKPGPITLGAAVLIAILVLSSPRLVRNLPALLELAITGLDLTPVHSYHHHHQMSADAGGGWSASRRLVVVSTWLSPRCWSRFAGDFRLYLWPDYLFEKTVRSSNDRDLTGSV